MMIFPDKITASPCGQLSQICLDLPGGRYNTEWDSGELWVVANQHPLPINECDILDEICFTIIEASDEEEFNEGEEILLETNSMLLPNPLTFTIRKVG